jgi:hypothetical protein
MDRLVGRLHPSEFRFDVLAGPPALFNHGVRAGKEFLKLPLPREFCLAGYLDAVDDGGGQQ